MLLNGIDISNWQENTPMDYDFCIIKASEGVGYKDPRLDQHYNEWKETEKPYGFYHYARPDLGNTAEAEAEWFLSLVGHHAGKAVFALDFEGTSLNVSGAAQWAHAWLNYVFNKTGVRPLFYIQGSAVSSGEYDEIFNDNYGCWAASELRFYTGHAAVVIQQTVTDIDHDVFYGDVDTWQRYAEGENNMDEIVKVERAVYRLYDPNNGSHMWTISYDEACSLRDAGWTYEGIAWLAEPYEK